MHGFLSLLLRCGFLRLTGDLKASSWSIMWSNAAENVFFWGGDLEKRLNVAWRLVKIFTLNFFFLLKNCQKARKKIRWNDKNDELVLSGPKEERCGKF